MARPTKKGMDYFPMDTDFFSDIKILRLLDARGAAGISAYVYVLCAAYRGNGYYIECDDNLVYGLAHELHIDGSEVLDIIRTCAGFGLFDAAIFNGDNVLTSLGMQRRYNQVCRQRKLKGGVTKHAISDNDAALIPEKGAVTSQETAPNTEETTETTEETAHASAQTGVSTAKNGNNTRKDGVSSSKTQNVSPEKIVAKTVKSGNNAVGSGVSSEKEPVSPNFMPTKERKGKEREDDVEGKKETASFFSPPPTDPSVMANFQQLADVDSLIDEFRGEQTFRDYCRMQNRITDAELDDYLERFRLFLHATDEHSKRRKDCKTHFLNWLRSQTAQAGRQQAEAPVQTEEPTERQVARVIQLYPECNHYAETLYRNYIREHGLKPDVALEHFERAHKNGLTYGNVIFRVQVDHKLLFKN